MRRISLRRVAHCMGGVRAFDLVLGLYHVEIGASKVFNAHVH